MRQSPNQVLIHIEGCSSKKAAEFYLGKTAVLVRKTQYRTDPAKYKPMYGKIIATHGKSGTVRSKFKTNLPPEFIGSEIRVMLY